MNVYVSMQLSSRWIVCGGGAFLCHHAAAV